MYFIMFFFGAIVMFIWIYIGYVTKPRNRVHFYVARHKDGSLWLYVGKPYFFNKAGKICYAAGNSSLEFEDFGLNVNDYDNLKCDDEPVEVFVNKED